MPEGTCFDGPLAFAAVPAAPTAVRRLRRTLLDLLFPPPCAVCRRPGGALCSDCRHRIDLSPAGPRGLASAPAASHLHGICSAGVYKPPLSVAIRAFKYRGRTDLAASLGALLVQAWQPSGARPAVVAAVPLHAKRLAERGYNQAELLAIEFCRGAGLPLVAPGLLERRRDTGHQVQLGLAERRENVKDAFAWTGPPLASCAVLLVDDVATTGSTLEACAGALATAGAGAVWALTVARAVMAPGHDDDRADRSRRTKEG